MSINNIKKFSYTITILSILLLWFISIIITVFEYDYLINSEIKKLHNATRSSAVYLGHRLETLHLFLKELANLIELNKDPYLINNQQVKTFISTFINHSDGNISIFLVDENGGLFLLPASSTTPLTDVSDREYFEAQKNPGTKGFYISSPIINRVTSEWNFAISYPVDIDDKTFIILLNAKLEELNNVIYKNFSDDHDIRITNVREDGDILFRYPMERELLGTKVPDDIFKLFNKDKSGSATSSPNYFEKNKYFIMYDSVPNYPIKVVCDLNYSKMRSNWLTRCVIRIFVNLIITLIIIFLVRKINIMLDELVKTNNKLEESSRYDSLTGLANRSYFYERFEDEIKRALRYGTDLVLIVIDLDLFKKINDTYGHPEGDSVLAKLGAILKRTVRSIDIPARVGGEEFAIVLPETSTNDGLTLAERLRKEIHLITLKKGHVTASFGMSVLSQNDTTDTIFSRADKALYAAKENGRDCIIVEN